MGGTARRYTDQSGNRLAMITVSVVVVCMALVVNIKVEALRRKRAFYREKEQALVRLVEEEKQRAEALEQYRIYVQTKEYIEKTAKEKLGLVNPDEILLKPEQQ